MQATVDNYEAVLYFDIDAVAYVTDPKRLRRMAAYMVEAATWLEDVAR